MPVALKKYALLFVKHKNGPLVVALILALFYWLLESIIDATVLRGNILVHLLPVTTHELWVRFSSLAMILAFGFYVRYTLRLIGKANAKRQENEENLRITLNSIGDGVIATDGSGNITRMNPAAEQLTGWKLAAAQGRALPRVFKIINDQTRETVKNPVEQVLKKGKTIGLGNHTVLIARDGREYHIADSGAPIRDDAGRIVGAVLVFQDVTEAYQLRKSIRESQARLAAIYQSSPAVIAVSSIEDGRYLQVNQAFTELTGWKPEEAVGKTAFELNIWAEPAAEQRQKLLEVLKKNNRVRNMEFVFQDRQGNRKIGLLSTEIIQIDGRPCLLNNVVDITDQRQIEKQVRGLKDFYQDVLDNVQDGIWVTDENDRIIFSNEGMERIAGIEADRIIGNQIPDSYDKETMRYFLPYYNRAKKMLHPQQYEANVVTPAGKETVQSGWLVPRIENGNYQGMICTVQDITIKKQVEEQLAFQSLILDQIQDMVTATDLEGRITYVNQAESKIFNMPPAQLIGQHVETYGEDPEQGATQQEIVETTRRQGHWRGEVVNITPNGAKIILDCRTQLLRDQKDNAIGMVGISTDITEHKAADARIEHLNSLLLAIRNINQLIVHSTDLQRLINKTCDSLIETRSYLGCTIAILDEKENRLKPMAAAGSHRFAKAWSVTTTGKGRAPKCVKKALKENKITVIQNTRQCGSCVYSGQHKHGNHSTVIIPMQSEGRNIGLLTVALQQKVQLDHQEQELLKEVADDLVFARDKLQAEEALHQSQGLLMASIEQTPAGILITDADDKKIKMVNSAALDILGGTSDQLHEMDIKQRTRLWKIFHPDGTPYKGDEMPVIRAISAGERVSGEEMIIEDKQGQRVPVIANAAPIRNDQGQITAGIVVFTDISDQKKALQALQESESRFKDIFETTQEGVAYATIGGKLIMMNNALEKITGVSRSELIGKNVLRIARSMLTAGEALQTIPKLTKAIQGNTIQSFQVNFKDKTLEVSAYFNPRSKRITGVVRNITAYAAAREKIRKDLAEKEVLLKEIHHRVKNNLQVISSLLSLQSGHLKDDQAKTALQICRDRVKSMGLVHDKLYRSESFNEVNFKEYLDDISLQLHRLYHSGRRIDMQIRAADYMVSIDVAIPCGIIVNELITNVLKYAFPDNRNGKIAIDFRSLANNRYQLKVQDNGIGLPAELDIENTESLGLKLVKMLTEQLEGELQVQSQKGTLFKITFPKPERKSE